MLNHNYVFVVFLILARLANGMQGLAVNSDEPNLSSVILDFTAKSTIDDEKKQRAFIVTLITFNKIVIEASKVSLNFALEHAALDESLSKDNWRAFSAANNDFNDYLTALKAAAGYDFPIFNDRILRPSMDEIIKLASEAVYDPDDLLGSYALIVKVLFEQLTPKATELLKTIYGEALTQLIEQNNEAAQAFLAPWDALDQITLMKWPLSIQLFLDYLKSAAPLGLIAKEGSSILLCAAAADDDCTMVLIPPSSTDLSMGFKDPWQLLHHLISLEWPSYIQLFFRPWLNAVKSVKIK